LAFPPRSASRNEEMEKRSRQRVRDQVALTAFGAETRMRSSARGLSMMARNATVPLTGRIQKRKTNHLQIVIFGLQRAAGPYRWAKAQSRCAPARCAGARAERPVADREDNDSEGQGQHDQQAFCWRATHDRTRLVSSCGQLHHWPHR